MNEKLQFYQSTLYVRMYFQYIFQLYTRLESYWMGYFLLINLIYDKIYQIWIWILKNLDFPWKVFLKITLKSFFTQITRTHKILKILNFSKYFAIVLFAVFSDIFSIAIFCLDLLLKVCLGQCNFSFCRSSRYLTIASRSKLQIE